MKKKVKNEKDANYSIMLCYVVNVFTMNISGVQKKRKKDWEPKMLRSSYVFDGGQPFLIELGMKYETYNAWNIKYAVWINVKMKRQR